MDDVIELTDRVLLLILTLGPTLTQSLHVRGVLGGEGPATHQPCHQDQPTSTAECHAPSKLGHQRCVDGIEQQATWQWQTAI